jgi:hypothetical protein
MNDVIGTINAPPLRARKRCAPTQPKKSTVLPLGRKPSGARQDETALASPRTPVTEGSYREARRPIMSLSDRLRELQRALDKVTGHVENELDKISHAAAVLDEIAAEQASAGNTGGKAARTRSSAGEPGALQEMAKAGALVMAISGNVDGSAEVRVNDGTSFRLQAKPAALLRIIAAPGGRATGDSLVGWRSYAEVAAALSKETGRVTTRRNVVHTIYRLRKAFRLAGQNWFLIQTDRRGNVRFALRSARVEEQS